MVFNLIFVQLVVLQCHYNHHLHQIYLVCNVPLVKMQETRLVLFTPSTISGPQPVVKWITIYHWLPLVLNVILGFQSYLPSYN